MASKVEIRTIKNIIKRVAFPKLGAVMVTHFKRNFRLQGYYSNFGVRKWKAHKKPYKQKGILIKSGALRRSIKVLKSNRKSITVGSLLPYASVHNKGFKGVQKVGSFTRNYKKKAKSGRKGRPITQEVGAHTRNQNIPARPFMKSNPKLTKELAQNIKRSIRKALK